ncbi:integrase arm-type DNA-binding domain-containing protein [Polynucleobacter sp. AP-Nino-20-G2]|uniref:tyrosine-type recombinase/integrase n=1 Tax=Polynucleobacter sp. AP-Nino-20-G2 TaxID=2576917 RepID=UPI001BFE977D|nr:integrase arm-type DNA-binding domain-containing protein [Polynucleobacter sp. AP-Nino-20-G2]QWE17083.1 tyrosine-type recombinase/integrase [Polynucleobacter sp. AP-Nino-20-G2]
MKLSAAEIKGYKPEEKLKKYSDGYGLNLYCYPNGSKLWRFRYRFGGIQKTLSLGRYPQVSLANARIKCAELRDALGGGVDPSDARREKKRKDKVAIGNSFEAVALKWHETWAVGKEPSHVKRVLSRLRANVFKEIGSKPITSITAPMLVAMVKKIESGENNPLEIAKRSFSTCGQIFRFAVAHGICERNPAADVRISDVVKSKPVVHRKRIDTKDLPKLLRNIDAYDSEFGGDELTKLAMQLMTLTFLRTSELIQAKWDEIDLKNKEWRIPAKRMKMRDPHIVHLTPQAISVFNRLREISGGRELIFPSEKPLKSMSNNTILFALYRMGYRGRMTGHGFRGVASTILHELGYPHEHIELQLAHSERNSVSAAYNFATYLPARARMMQEWADYLDAIKAYVANTKS